MIIDPMTWSQRASINKLIYLLVKLNIKSARTPETIINLIAGSRAILKINGKPIAFAQGVTYVNDNAGIIPIIGSDN